MSEHYVSKKPQSQSKPKVWNYQLRENNYTFTSDVGVFSKDEVDFGTRLLIEKFKIQSINGEILYLVFDYGLFGFTLADCSDTLLCVLCIHNVRFSLNS